MLNSAILLLAASLGQTDMTSTPDEFREFGERVVGRWTGDITLIADWPGMKKKAGEKVVDYRTSRWIVDGKAFIDTVVGGENTGFALWCYDPVKKQIKVQVANSAGGTVEAVLWKESPTAWPFKITGGGLADGRDQSGQGRFVFKDEGKTYVVEGKFTLAGKELLPLHDVYTRLSP